MNSVKPLTSSDLAIKVNRRRKKTISPYYIKLAAKISADIEIVGDDRYQIRFEKLSSLADKAYRVLYETGHPLHYREIWKGITHRMSKAGLMHEGNIRNMTIQLADERYAKGRFGCIGRSGCWSLTEWENVCRDTIFDLIREFMYSRNSTATPKEIYVYVNSKRPGVSMGTIYMYLHTRRDIFARLGRNLYGLTDRQSNSG